MTALVLAVVEAWVLGLVLVASGAALVVRTLRRIALASAIDRDFDEIQSVRAFDRLREALGMVSQRCGHEPDCGDLR